VTHISRPRGATAPDPVVALLDLPGVADAVASARDACTRLRWHQALRRRIPEAAAESRVRGATASALLEGAEVAGSQGSVRVVRDLVRGAQGWPVEPDPVWRTLRCAVQVTAATEHVGAAQLAAPAQVLAHLHVAAASLVLPAGQVGRPRGAGEECAEWVELGPPPEPVDLAGRLAGLAELLGGVPQGRAPALLVASLVHAEVVAARPFVQGNGLVARALERVVLRAGGLDPTGVAVPEAGHAEKVGADYRGALTAYVSGGPEGVRLWLLHCAEAAETAAAHGIAVADAVLAGRTV
jgi:hypothetical protein